MFLCYFIDESILGHRLLSCFKNDFTFCLDFYIKTLFGCSVSVFPDQCVRIIIFFRILHFEKFYDSCRIFICVCVCFVGFCVWFLEMSLGLGFSGLNVSFTVPSQFSCPHEYNDPIERKVVCLCLSSIKSFHLPHSGQLAMKLQQEYFKRNADVVCNLMVC